MSKQDLIRFKVIEVFREGKITRQEAAQRLEVGERQLSRLALKCRKDDIEGLIHKNRGRAPQRPILQMDGSPHLWYGAEKCYPLRRP